jgi:succinylglutamic semialdehyde dehydrogenase
MSAFQSIDPSSGEVVWEGQQDDASACAAAVARARAALPGWREAPLETRVAAVRRFAALLEAERESLAELISRETGKLLSETRGEVGAMIGKVSISIAAQTERAGTRETPTDFGRAVLRHRGHGVMAVLGPYNFPGHLPNGHIVPALLAGNTIVFKPSEITPAVGAAMVALWQRAGLPQSVINLVQGGRHTGEALVAADIDGLLFTGSAAAGSALKRATIDRPHLILALELGGNNPLVVWDSPEAAASIIVHSAFATTGQRCSCARRLIVPSGSVGDNIIAALDATTSELRVASWEDLGGFMGPLVSDQAAAQARAAIDDLVARGARNIRPMTGIAGRRHAFVTPAIVDVTGIEAPDAEIFAPVIQVIRVSNFTAALDAANATGFGLTSGLVSGDEGLWQRFLEGSRAGIVNWNRPTTGAASNMPFGGVGTSGNHRPSAYYAADYCAYPIASFEAPVPTSLALP